MGNKLSSDTWLRASDEVTNELLGVFQLVDDILIGARDYEELVTRLEALLVRCDAANMTLLSNKVQVVQLGPKSPPCLLDCISHFQAQ